MKSVKACYIFICPPSLEVLEQRLKGRSTETKEMIENRLSRSKEELKAGKDYDYVVVNDDIEEAFSAIESIIKAQEHKIDYQQSVLVGLRGF